MVGGRLKIVTLYGMFKGKKVPLCVVREDISFYCAKALSYMYSSAYANSDYFMIPNPPPPECEGCDLREHRAMHLKNLKGEGRPIYAAWKGYLSELRSNDVEIAVEEVETKEEEADAETSTVTSSP